MSGTRNKPAAEVAIKKNRRKLMRSLVIVNLAVLAAMAFWAVPKMGDAFLDKTAASPGPVPAMAKMLIDLAGLFKVFTVIFLVAGGGLIVLCHGGGLDRFIPFLNVILGLFVTLVLGLTIYAVLAPGNG